MESSRMACKRLHGELRDRELPAGWTSSEPPVRPSLSPLAQAASDSRLANVCPVCAGAKEKFGIFCGRCRDLLPRAKWRQHVPADLNPEGYARWWAEACRDLRGE